jgi:hypothetical protein
MGKSGGGWQTQSKGGGVTVRQGTNNPRQVDTIVSEKGSSKHVHHVASKATGKTLYEGWGKNTPKKK